MVATDIKYVDEAGVCVLDWFGSIVIKARIVVRDFKYQLIN